MRASLAVAALVALLVAPGCTLLIGSPHDDAGVPDEGDLLDADVGGDLSSRGDLGAVDDGGPPGCTVVSATQVAIPDVTSSDFVDVGSRPDGHAIVVWSAQLPSVVLTEQPAQLIALMPGSPLQCDSPRASHQLTAGPSLVGAVCRNNFMAMPVDSAWSFRVAPGSLATGPTVSCPGTLEHILAVGRYNATDIVVGCGPMHSVANTTQTFSCANLRTSTTADGLLAACTRSDVVVDIGAGAYNGGNFVLTPTGIADTVGGTNVAIAGVGVDRYAVAAWTGTSIRFRAAGMIGTTYLSGAAQPPLPPTTPLGLAALPDGYLLALERNSTVELIHLSESGAMLPPLTGLPPMAAASHPQLAFSRLVAAPTQGNLYVAYSDAATHAVRLVRATLSCR